MGLELSSEDFVHPPGRARSPSEEKLSGEEGSSRWRCSGGISSRLEGDCPCQGRRHHEAL